MGAAGARQRHDVALSPILPWRRVATAEAAA